MTPSPLHLAKSFGFGDRLGLATPGHWAAARKTDFAPVFAQQSIREMTRTQRRPKEVIECAVRALTSLGYAQPWGADADHLKTPEDARATAAAGFTLFTIDPSAHVENQADKMDEKALDDWLALAVQDGIFDLDWMQPYLDQVFDIGAQRPLRLERAPLKRAAVKYGRALDHCAKMAKAIADACRGRAYEIEISVDETETPTSPEEHLFVSLELKRRQAPFISLAPRFVGEFEKGIDYRGDLSRFEADLRMHVAVARFCGPYKISIHSGSDKFAVYPIIGRCCGRLLHVKTAGTSYLEALRAVARVNPELFMEIAAFAHGRFSADRASYFISTTEAEVNRLPRQIDQDLEAAYLNQRPGRQLMHVTFGSVLTLGKTSRGGSFKEAILEILAKHADLHGELLERHLGKHLKLLNAG